MSPEADAARFETGVVSDSKYAVCRRCDLLFARRRQDEGDAEAYYRAFEILEKRDYAVYPPPEFYLEKQIEFSEWLLDQLDAAGVLSKCGSVLNIRCENGVHLANLRDKYNVREVYGLDHFASNLRYARENHNIQHVEFLHPVDLDVPFERRYFDLILANHQITHALEPLKLIKRFRNLLSPRGVLVLYNENDHLRLLCRKRIFHEGAGNYHKQLLTPHSLRNLCQLAGLSWQQIALREKAIKWACPRDSMVAIARRVDAVPSGALPRMIGSPTLRAMRLGRSVHFAYRAGKQLEKIYRRPAA